MLVIVTYFKNTRHDFDFLQAIFTSTSMLWHISALPYWAQKKYIGGHTPPSPPNSMPNSKPALQHTPTLSFERILSHFSFSKPLP